MGDDISISIPLCNTGVLFYTKEGKLQVIKFTLVYTLLKLETVYTDTFYAVNIFLK